MEVTTVSHAGIANRIKNILSAMAQYDKVNTLYDTINYIFPSIPKVDNAVNTFPEDWNKYLGIFLQKIGKTLLHFWIVSIN